MTRALPDYCSSCGAHRTSQVWTPLRDTVARTLEHRIDGSDVLDRPAAMTVKHFLKLFDKSGLNGCNTARLYASKHKDNLADLATALVANRILTTWQCKMLFQKRFRGFLLGRYELLEPLPSGEYRTVFLGRNVATHRRTRFELLPRQLHKRELRELDFAMLLHKVEKFCTLEHPELAAILDADFSGGVHYLAREHVDGPRLRDVVETLGRLPCDVAATICARVGLAIAYAHKNEYVFGCLDPKEILLSLDGVVKLAAIGMPREREAFALRQMLAQEQLAEKYLDPVLMNCDMCPSEQSDVFSLGCILCFALTGREPVSVHSWSVAVEDLVGEQRDCEKSSLRSICARMMAPTPGDRHKSVQAAACDLAEWLAGIR
jgi:serine/threonine protein kinase